MFFESTILVNISSEQGYKRKKLIIPTLGHTPRKRAALMTIFFTYFNKAHLYKHALLTHLRIEYFLVTWPVH